MFTGSTNLAFFLAEEERRRRSAWGVPVALTFDATAELPPVAIDAESLRSLLSALLDNAREALAGSPGGAVTVTVRSVELSPGDCLNLYGEPQPGPHVELCVVDNGPGLSADAAQRLFAEPFYSTKPRQRGFGLALAYGITTAHRGGLDVRSAPLHGTVARAVLPVVAPTEPAPRGFDHPGTERILVVDDDPLILQFVCTTLQQAGYRVAGAGSAEEAARSHGAATRDPFDLVLSDVVMPHATGVDLARRLISRDAGVQMLFMSGQVTSDFLDADIACHRFELLSKPFPPQSLLQAVRAALDRGAAIRRVAVRGNGSPEKLVAT